MQILPDSFLEQLDNSLDYAGNTRSSRTSRSSFALELSKSLRDKADKAPLPGSAEEEDNDSLKTGLAAAPYNPTPHTYSSFEPQPVRYTPSEAERLTDGLKTEGVPQAALTAINDVAQTPGGPTMEMVVHAAREAIEGKPVALSKEETAHLNSVTDKIAGEHGEDLRKQISQGTPADAMRAVMSYLKNAEHPIQMTQGEMAALLKSLRVPADAAKTALKAFGEGSMLTLSGNELRSLLEPARLALEKNAADMDKLQAALAKHMPGVFKDASKREEMERLSSAHEDRAVSQSRLLMKDTATQAAPGREDQPEQAKQTRAVSHREDNSQEKKNEHAHNATGPVQPDGKQPPMTAHDGHGDARSQQRDNQKSRPDSSQGKAEPATAATRSASQNASGPANPLFATVAHGVGTVMPQAPTAGQAPVASALSARAMEQIEQAILSANANGTRRLEVALNPMEGGNLGSMTVVLTTSRTGEVSALIKPDRAETAALIMQQADKIKAELENQGFRVEKVDVQTELADQNGQNWQGADQHNATRDMAARTQELERLRLLGRGMEDIDPSLAHDMQIQARTATVAGQGLHLVA